MPEGRLFLFFFVFVFFVSIYIILKFQYRIFFSDEETIPTNIS